MKKNIYYISLFIAFVSLGGCGGSENNSDGEQVDSVKENVDKPIEKGIVLYNTPSPIETFTILKMSGASFDKTLLNPINNKSKYLSSFSKSINLGTYSTDLSFSLVYKQNQDVNIYLQNVNELTAGLGIDDSFGQSIAKRLKENTNNMDSLMRIVTEASVNANLYLKENQRDNTTVLIAAGGWIEGMHIIANIASKGKQEEVMGLVSDQKNAIKNIILMLQQFQSDPEIVSLLTDIKDISTIYDTLKLTQENATVSDDKTIASIGNNQSYDLTAEQLKSILKKVETLRNKLTS
jgi:hypothetical protein